MYGLFALAKTDVPIASDGSLNYAGADGLEYACAAADYNNPDTIYSVKVQPGCVGPLALLPRTLSLPHLALSVAPDGALFPPWQPQMTPPDTTAATAHLSLARPSRCTRLRAYWTRPAGAPSIWAWPRCDAEPYIDHQAPVRALVLPLCSLPPPVFRSPPQAAQPAPRSLPHLSHRHVDTSL